MNKVNFRDEASRMSILRSILETNLAKNKDCASKELMNAELKLYNAAETLLLFCEKGSAVGKIENKEVLQALSESLSAYLQTKEYELAEYQSEIGIVDHSLKTRFEVVINLAKTLGE